MGQGASLDCTDYRGDSKPPPIEWKPTSPPRAAGINPNEMSPHFITAQQAKGNTSPPPSPDTLPAQGAATTAGIESYYSIEPASSVPHELHERGPTEMPWLRLPTHSSVSLERVKDTSGTHSAQTM